MEFLRKLCLRGQSANTTPSGPHRGKHSASQHRNTKRKKQQLIVQANSPSEADLPLDLDSLWFAKSPPAFPPPSINRLPGSRFYSSSSGWSSNGVRRTHTFTGAIRHTNSLATTIIHLTWDASNPQATVKARQKYTPAPPPLTAHQLANYQQL